MKRQKFQKLCDALGVTFTIDAENFEMFSPKGKLFAGNELYSYLTAELNDLCNPITRSQLYEEHAEILKLGLQDCLDSECDHCNENVKENNAIQGSAQP